MPGYWIRLIEYVSIPWVVLAVVHYLRSRRVLAPRCPECHSKLEIKERILQQPGADSYGAGVRVRVCPGCAYHDEIPFRVEPYAAWGDGRFDWFRDTDEFREGMARTLERAGISKRKKQR